MIVINNIDVLRNNYVLSVTHSFITMSHVIYQQFLCWLQFILYFLRVLYTIRNHRFNINDFCFSITYKMREVKQHRYLQNPQLIFDMPTSTHNPCLTQCQSISLMTHFCMLTHVSRHPRMASENKKTININITTTMKY